MSEIKNKEETKSSENGKEKSWEHQWQCKKDNNIDSLKIQEDINQNSGDSNTLHIETKRFWGTCQVERPPFASHCSACNQWVVNFDHHCAVLNCCIGGRNLHNFVLLQFILGIGAFYALYAIPVYYYEVYYELDEDKQDFLEEHKFWLIGSWFGGFCSCMLALFGAMWWACIGMLGYGYATYIIFKAMWEQSTWNMNPYPFICSFGMPIFVGTFFMALIYFVLIMQGRNK